MAIILKRSQQCARPLAEFYLPGAPQTVLDPDHWVSLKPILESPPPCRRRSGNPNNFRASYLNDDVPQKGRT